MVTEATKEVFALFNILCGGLIFLGLLLYLVFSKQRRSAVALAFLLVILLCLINAVVVYLYV